MKCSKFMRVDAYSVIYIYICFLANILRAGAISWSRSTTTNNHDKVLLVLDAENSWHAHLLTQPIHKHTVTWAWTVDLLYHDTWWICTYSSCFILIPTTIDMLLHPKWCQHLLPEAKFKFGGIHTLRAECRIDIRIIFTSPCNLLASTSKVTCPH